MKAVVLRGLSWWIEGLWLGLPSSWRSRWLPARDRILVIVRGDRVVCELNSPTGEVDTREIPLSGGTELPDWTWPSADIALVLDRSDALTKTFSFPLAAERDLRLLLGHELDRVTPFSAHDIHYDFDVLTRDRSAGRMRVLVGIMRRDRLQDILGELRRLGIEPRAATMRDSDGKLLRLNWIQRAAELRLPFTGSPIRPTLITLAVAALLLLLYGPVLRYESLSASYGAAADEARQSAMELQEASAAKSEALARGEFLAEVERSYVSPLDILALLSDTLPDDAWLTRFAMTQGTVQLQGEAVGATSLLERVSALDLLERAEFQSPVAAGSIPGKERFSLRADVVTREPPE